MRPSLMVAMLLGGNHAYSTAIDQHPDAGLIARVRACVGCAVRGCAGWSGSFNWLTVCTVSLPSSESSPSLSRQFTCALLAVPNVLFLKFHSTKR